MSNYDNAEVIRALTPAQVNKLSNPQLKQALNVLLTESQPSNNDILEEIRGLRQQVVELQGIKQEFKKEINVLHNKLDDAFKIISQQQLFLETLDNKERRQNLVITGLSEEADATGATDVEKVRAVVRETGYKEAFDPETWEIRRLGKPDDRKKRPMLVVVGNGEMRNNILKGAKNLKSSQGQFSTVFLKRDQHPAVRKENARLRAREKEEKEKPENVSANIMYDWKNRVLLRNGDVIDKFSPNFF